MNTVKRGIRFALILLAALGVVNVVNAVPDSVVVYSLAQSGTETYDWTSPAGGSLNGYSGDTWVTGSGSLFDGGGDTYNGWVTTYADAEYGGLITDVDEGAWKLTVTYPGRIVAKTTYIPTGLFPVEEDYRAETTGTAEVRGDFAYFDERQVVVDSYTTEGISQYDAVGGGANPQTYADGGWSWVTTAQSGQTTRRSYSFGALCPVQWHDDVNVSFFLYARGKQYMHGDEEEDVSLGTTVKAGTDSQGNNTGWFGTLESFEVLGNGTTNLIRIHIID